MNVSLPKMNATFFATPVEFRKWLKKNHQKKAELMVGYYKVGSGKPSITWSESVDQALCFGWIDGIRRSIDKDSYCIRFTPRRPDSIWSAINIKKIKELTAAGLMTPEGEKAFNFWTEDKSNIYSHEKAPAILESRYEKTFKKNKTAWDFFTKQAPSYQKLMTYWIMNAKQEKTRTSRLEKIMAISEQHKRMS